MNQNKSVKIRFKGFTETWEQRKLEELTSIFDGTHQTPQYTKEGVMFLSVENISTLLSQKFISKEDFNRNFPVKPAFGDVLMTRIGDVGTANMVRSDRDLAFYVSLALLKPKNVNSLFLTSAIASPFVQMSQTFQKQANLLWYEIFDIVKQNCTTKFDGTPQDDLMEQLLSSRK